MTSTSATYKKQLWILAVALLVAAAFAAPADAKRGKAPQDAEEYVSKKIARLHDKLKITQEQETVWGDIAKIMRENAFAYDAIFKKWEEKGGALTAIDSMKMHEEVIESHAAGHRKLIPVFEKLYNMMPSEQKALADDEFARYQKRKHHKKK